MTAPLPLRYGRGRSLVDRTRVRWGGFGDLLLGLGLLVFGSLGTKLVGVLFIALGLATWFVTRFGSTHYSKLSPARKAVVVVGALGYLFLGLFHLIWLLGNKIADLVTKPAKPPPTG